MFRKELVIVVRRRDGRVETRRVVVDKAGGGDLVTLWGFRLFCCLFAEAVRGSTVNIEFVDLGGVSRSFACIDSRGDLFLGSGCSDRAPFIGFGSSTVAPSRSDFKVVSELARVRGSTVVDESAFTCSIAGSWTPTSGVNVCEVGLYMRVCDGGGYDRFVLFDRSVLSPCVSVGAGETISVAYVFSF